MQCFQSVFDYALAAIVGTGVVCNNFFIFSFWGNYNYDCHGGEKGLSWEIHEDGRSGCCMIFPNINP